MDAYQEQESGKNKKEVKERKNRTFFPKKKGGEDAVLKKKEI